MMPKDLSLAAETAVSLNCLSVNADVLDVSPAETVAAVEQAIATGEVIGRSEQKYFYKERD